MSISNGNPIVIAADLNAAEKSYSDGYLRFNTALSDAGDQLSLMSSTDPSAKEEGKFSKDASGLVYIGTGSALERIGFVDQGENGENGNPLKIHFSVPLPNGGFDDGLTQWKVQTKNYSSLNDGLDLSKVNVSNGAYLSNPILGALADPNTPPAGTGRVENIDGDNALYLGLSGGWFATYNNGDPQSYHGPSARSESTIEIKKDESISLSFKASARQDHYEVFGFLRKIANPETGALSTNADDNILLFANRGGETPWINVVSDKLAAGTYVLEFIAGSYDATDGGLFGADLWIDDIRIKPSTEIDAGLVNALAAAVQYTTTGEVNESTPATRTVTVEAATVTEATQGTPPSVSKGFELVVPEFDQAPQWNGKPGVLPSILEDALNPAGATVASVFFPVLVDPDVGETPDGVAIAINGSDHLRGTWEYRTPTSAAWEPIGLVGPDNMLLLDGNAMVRFVPAPDWNTDLGKLPALEAYAVAGVDDFTSPDSREYLGYTDAGNGITLSDTRAPVSSSVIPVNDPARFPTAGIDHNLDGASPTAFRGAIDAYDPEGDPLAYSLPDGKQDTFSPLGNGVSAWQEDGVYGTLWINQQTGEYLYQPKPEAIEPIPQGVEKVDTFNALVSDGAGGLVTQPIRIKVAGANQAPTTKADTVELNPILEDDAAAWTGSSINDLFGQVFKDIDALDTPDTLGGIAIVTNDSDERGTWEYKVGDDWVAIGEVSPSHALLLDAGTLLRFAPAEHWNSHGERSVPALEAHLVDSSLNTKDYTDAAEQRYLDLDAPDATGGHSPVSLETVTLDHDVTAVNDEPTGEIQLSGVAEVGKTLVATITQPVADVDGPTPVEDAADFTYQWQREDEPGKWVDIDGATDKSYTLTADDANTPVRFVVSYTDDDGHPNVLASEQSPVVANPHSAADGEAPQFTSASVNGNTLTLRYTDDGSLDPASLPVAGQFEIVLGGTPVAVNAIAINGDAKTVTLTLEVAARPGQSARIWYHPEIDEDGKPIQDNVGNDAGALLGVAVTNQTPSPAQPSEPAPAPAPTPQRPIGEVADGRKTTETQDDGTEVTIVTGRLGDGRVTETIAQRPDGNADYTLNYNPGSGGGTGVALPLLYEAVVGSPHYTTATLPTHVHLVAHGLRLPEDGAGKLDLIEAIQLSVDGGDNGKPGMLDGGQAFLDALPDAANLWVNRIELKANPGVESVGTIVIDGAVSGAGIGEHREALVIDASGLPDGTTLALHNIDFAVIVGQDMNVTGNSSDILLFGDESAQTFNLDGDNATVHAGGDDDIIVLTGKDGLAFGNAGEDILTGGQGKATLHGGLDADAIHYAGSIEDYEIVRDHGITWVTSRANPDQVHQVINAEAIVFEDATYQVENAVHLTWIASLYNEVLGRQAEVSGFQYWAKNYTDGKSIGEIGLSMLYSKEYNSTEDTEFAALSTGDQISLLYQHFLGREAEADGHAYWVNEVANGANISQIADNFITSVEMAGNYLQAEQWDFYLA